MKRRIVHVIESLGIGGAQSMMFELYYAIDNYFKDYPQTIILTNEKSLDNKYINSYGISFDTVSNTKQFTQKILEYREPIIVVYHKLMCSNLDYLRGVFKKVPVIVINHTFSQNRMHNRIRNCDGIVSVCNFMKNELSNKFHVKGNHEAIHNGVNAYRYQDILPQPRDRENRLITGRVNCLNAIKYSDDWIDWVASVKLPFTLVHDYIGGGATSRAKQVLEDIGDKRNEVNILGAIQHFEKKIAIVKSWDLFLYEINRDEGVSIAILESLACGVPVVCSNHFGNKEIIEDGVNGYVYKTKPEAREILLDLGNNKEKLENLKKSTLAHFYKNLDAKVTASNYIEFIEKTITYRVSKKKGVVTLGGGHQETRKKLKSKRVLSARPRRRIKNTIGRIKQVSEKNKVIHAKKEKAKENKDIKIKKTKRSNMVFVNNLEKNKTGDKFSILTAAHNGAPYIQEWSESILSQAYRPLEVVVVNDASTDKTKEELSACIDKFAKNEIAINIIDNKKKQGCGSSYCQALDKASGEFMGVLDIDDMLVPESVSFIMDVYNTFPNIGWVYSQYDNYSDSKKKVTGRGLSSSPKQSYSLLDMGRINKHTYSHWRTFSAKRIEKSHKIFKEGLNSGVDKYMGYRLEELADGMFIDKVLYRYRKDVPGCISKTEPARKTWDLIMKEAEKRRKKYKIKPYPIVTLKM